MLPVDIAIIALNDHSVAVLDNQRLDAYWYRFLGWLIFISSEKVDTKKAPQSPQEFLPFEFEPKVKAKVVDRPSLETVKALLDKIDNNGETG